MSDPRPGNAGRADYPRMLYHANGGMIIVHTPEEHDQLHKDGGWDTVPAEVHQQRQPSASPAMGTRDPLGEMFRQVLNEVLDERNIGKRRR